MVIGKAVVRAVAEELIHEVHPHDLATSPAVALRDLLPAVLAEGVLAEDRQGPRTAEKLLKQKENVM